MTKNNFISKFLQIFGSFSAIALAVSQYIFQDNFKVMFGEHANLFGGSSLVALILSLAIILIVFVKRHFLTRRFYLSPKKKNEYFNYLNNLNNNQDTNEEQDEIERVAEPRYITIEGFAIISLIIALIAFGSFLYFNNEVITSITYIIFVVSVVFIFSTFSIQLYVRKDFSLKEERKQEIIMNKIKEHFIGGIRIHQSWQTQTKSGLKKYQHLIVEWDGDLYRITVNPNNPNDFFSINPHNPNS